MEKFKEAEGTFGQKAYKITDNFNNIFYIHESLVSPTDYLFLGVGTEKVHLNRQQIRELSVILLDYVAREGNYFDKHL